MHHSRSVLMPIHSHSSTFFPPPPSPSFSPAKTMADIEFRAVLNRILTALLTCGFAFVGSVIGIFSGAIKGQTTETGIVRGAAVGAVTGAITALQVMDMIAAGEPFSKVALLHSLLNGKVFVEWVGPAVLKAYQWQTSTTEMNFIDLFDMENTVTNGLSEDTLNKLPKCRFSNPSDCRQKDSLCNDTNCAICLQDFKNEEEGRELPSCRHVFHLKCIDEWLVRQGSCPICRRDI